MRTATRGRPRAKVDLDELRRLRQRGLSFRRIARALGIAPSTAFHLWRDGTTPRNDRKGVQKFPRGDYSRSPLKQPRAPSCPDAREIDCIGIMNLSEKDAW